MSRIKINQKIVLDYDCTYRNKYWGELSSFIINKYGKKTYSDPQKVEYEVAHHHNLIPIDINNDGKTDIIETYSNIVSTDRFPEEKKESYLKLYENIQVSTLSFRKGDTYTTPYTGLPPHYIFSPSDDRDVFMDISMFSGNEITTLYSGRNIRKNT